MTTPAPLASAVASRTRTPSGNARTAHDQLSEVLALVRVRATLSGAFAADGRWVSRADVCDQLKIIAVMQGRVAVRADDAPAVHLEAGDIAVLNGRSWMELRGGGGERGNACTVDPPDGYADDVRLDGSRADVVLGGHLDLDDTGRAVVQQALPALAHLRASVPQAASMRRSLRHLFEESAHAAEGSAFALQQYGQLLVLEILRACARLTELPPGWLRALADERLRPALAVMHSDPGARWSLDELARAARMSRTAFAERFRASAGAPAHAYLTRWRMLLAQHALVHEDATVAALAARLGYGSESAFSHAFTREVGQSPQRFRARPVRPAPPHWRGEGEGMTSRRLDIHGAHLVGSVNLPTAQEVFATAASVLGDDLDRLPDGETGERYYWINFQTFRFDRTPGLRRVGAEPFLLRDQFDLRPFALDGSVAPDDLRLGELGYAEAALESWARFRALQEAGSIPPHLRFQVSLPTPAAVVGLFVVPEDRARVEPAYARALYGELDRILDAVPHASLAVQWDTAIEFAWLEGAAVAGQQLRPWWDDVAAGVIARAAEGAARVPAGVQLGYHLCYGDIEGAHFAQPESTRTLATIAEGLLAAAPRDIDWIHVPVPIDRDDEAYFAPLGEIALPAPTRLYLGLVHLEDGAAGALRRARAASAVLESFGIATECGLGRRSADATREVLHLHRAILSDAARATS